MNHHRPNSQAVQNRMDSCRFYIFTNTGSPRLCMHDVLLTVTNKNVLLPNRNDTSESNESDDVVCPETSKSSDTKTSPDKTHVNESGELNFIPDSVNDIKLEIQTSDIKVHTDDDKETNMQLKQHN